MSNYAAPRRDGEYPNDPTHESPYNDSFYGNESEYFENSYSLEEHDPYRDDPTHFSHMEPPSESEHLHTEFDDEYDDDPYNANQQRLYESDSNFDDPHDPRYADQYSEYDQSHTGGGDDNASIPESQYTYDTATRRDFKYSTANVKRHGWCYKFCCIFLLFMIFFIISTLISMLVQKLIFGDDDAGDDSDLPVRDLNGTFPREKAFINQVCSSTTIDIDGGARCQEDCQPQFYECCDPFKDFDVLNMTSFLEITNETLPPMETDDDEVLLLREWQCSFGKEVRGCVAYAKCQAISEKVDPAPSNLPYLCNEETLATDPEACEEICRNARCCFNDEGESCVADDLDICMDYAPCQNLRATDNLLLTAPEKLDHDCFYGFPTCHEECEKAACCNDRNSRCFQENFMACLTYAPCNNVSEAVEIVIPEIFTRLPMPPAELIYACDEDQTELEQEHLKPCAEYCQEARCCYEQDPSANCFHDDPLGCLLWHQHCQVEPELMAKWWTGKE